MAPDPRPGLDGLAAEAPISDKRFSSFFPGSAPASQAECAAAGGPVRLGGEWYAPDVGTQLARRLEREAPDGWPARISSLSAAAWVALAVGIMAVAGAVGYWVGTSAPGVDSASVVNGSSVGDARREVWRLDPDPALLPVLPAPSSPVAGASPTPAMKAGEPEQKIRARRDSAPTKLGAAVYKEVCSACHDPGRGSGPAVDRPELWMERFARGKETLYASVRDGKGEMKPKGGNPALGTEELEAAVDYMTDRIIRLNVERAVARMPFAGNGELSLSNSAPPREDGPASR
jgi:cytochrome c5